MDKQGFNGNRGESRTYTMLSEFFMVYTPSIDINGGDYYVQALPTLPNDEVNQKAGVIGVIQAKFFENINAQHIAKKYVVDNQGVKTDFFTFLHTTDDNYQHHHYFFTASDIANNFTLVHKDGKDYFRFAITKERDYEKFRDIPMYRIAEIITDRLCHTQVVRNAEYLSHVNDWNNHKDILQYANRELFQALEGQHIADKLYTALKTYNDFRTIYPSRLVRKINFPHKHNTYTDYYEFTLHSNNQEIIDFFSAIKIAESVEIIDAPFFKNVKVAKEKVNAIVQILNNNNIIQAKFNSQKQSIALLHNMKCNCPVCTFEQLALYNADRKCKDPNTDTWKDLAAAYTYYSLGKFAQARTILEAALASALQHKQPVLKFICYYNLEIIYSELCIDSDVNLAAEFNKLELTPEKKEALKPVADYSLLNNYLRRIDSDYLTVREYKVRTNNNATATLISRQRACVAECMHFFKGNRFFITEDFGILFEKYIESCIISISMQVPYRAHLAGFDDFIIECILLHCPADKLLNYLQRNDIQKIQYDSTQNTYFTSAFNNFFSKENLTYLQDEITSADGRVENPKLRQSAIRIFNCFAVLLSYLDVPLVAKDIEGIHDFTEILDFKPDEYSSLAHPILSKPGLFSEAALLRLVKNLLDPLNEQSYLLTNCLLALGMKQFILDSTDPQWTELTIYSIDNPDYHIVKGVLNVMDEKGKKAYDNSIYNALATAFNPALYHQGVTLNCLTNAFDFFDLYQEYMQGTITKQTYRIAQNYGAYSGVNNYISEQVRNFIEVLYCLGKIDPGDYIAKQVKALYPGYRFLLDIETYNDTEKFHSSWLIETSNIILKKLATYPELKKTMDRIIPTETSTIIQKIYLKYFLNAEPVK
jgi:hypothetical protein